MRKLLICRRGLITKNQTAAPAPANTIINTITTIAVTAPLLKPPLSSLDPVGLALLGVLLPVLDDAYDELHDPDDVPVLEVDDLDVELRDVPVLELDDLDVELSDVLVLELDDEDRELDDVLLELGDLVGVCVSVSGT